MPMSKRKLVERPYNMGTLTEAAFFGKIRSALRNAFRYWKPAQEALNRASRPSQNKTNLRLKKEFQCAECKKWHKRADVEIDHIIECGSLSCYNDIVPFIKRLAPENPNAYQVLCKPCHRLKSNEAINKRKQLKNK